MKINIRIILRFVALPLLVAPTAVAQSDASGKIRGDLETALADLAQTRREHAGLRRKLYGEINELDDHALKLGKELRGLERDEEMRASRARQIKGEIQARKVEMDYVNGVLKQYSQALLARMHPAENQRYEEKLETAARRAEAASSSANLAGELAERLAIVKTGLERTNTVIGGDRFPGKALRNGSETLEGVFAIFGPAVFFSGADGFEGVATFAQTGTELPTVVAVRDVDAGSLAKTIGNGNGSLPFDSSMGKALEVEAAHESLVQIAEKGGVVGYAILLLGSLAIGITIFKLIEISRFPVPSRRKINEIIDDLVAGRPEEARRRAGALPGMSGELVRTGVELFHERRRVLEESIFEKIVAIKPRLDRFLPFLGLTAAAAPLMGLLGTVLGIIKTFKAMAIYGTGNAKSFSAGISEALITTAEGLVVAIPVLVLHGLMRSYAKRKFGEVESIGISLLNGTTEIGRSKTRGFVPPDDEEGAEDDLDLGKAQTT